MLVSNDGTTIIWQNQLNSSGKSTTSQLYIGTSLMTGLHYVNSIQNENWIQQTSKQASKYWNILVWCHFRYTDMDEWKKWTSTVFEFFSGWRDVHLALLFAVSALSLPPFRFSNALTPISHKLPMVFRCYSECKSYLLLNGWGVLSWSPSKIRLAF